VNLAGAAVEQSLTNSQLAAFKYRHQTREGHMEDSLPTLNQDVRDVSLSYCEEYCKADELGQVGISQVLHQQVIPFSILGLWSLDG
jgi:hypothetical protein